MCRCDPRIRTPFCGKTGCEWPKSRLEDQLRREISRLRSEKMAHRSFLLDEMAKSICDITRQPGEDDSSLFSRLERHPMFEDFREDVLSRVRFNLNEFDIAKDFSFMDELKKL